MMVSINVDNLTELQLASNPVATICSQTGVPIGRFLSETAFHRLVYDWAAATMSDEELDRRRAEGGGRELAEFWQEMGR